LEARLADVNQHKVEYRTNILTDNDWTYIAGFGSSLGDKQMQWQYAADRLYGYKWCRQAPATGVSTHPIPHTSPAATDISSTYEYPHGNMENKLQPGTSGSIAIDQHNQVVGIHWGEDRGHESVCWLTANGKDVRFTPTYTNIITILKAWMDSESI
jgi:V8-like Glu-specific endopeptidase